MHQESRNRLVERFKTDATVPAGSVILMQGGCSETRHETDHEKLFRQESSFNYLFGVKEPDCYASIDVDSGKTTLYIPRLPEDYAIWMGEIKPPSFYLNHYQVDECLFVDELKDVRDAVDRVERRSDSLMHFVQSYRRLTRLSPPEKEHLVVKKIFEDISRVATINW